MDGKKINTYFEPVRFSNEMIRDSFVILPLLSEMRNKYMKIILKLKHLERKSNEIPPKDEINHYLSKWKEIVNFELLKNATKSNFS